VIRAVWGALLQHQAALFSEQQRAWLRPFYLPSAVQSALSTRVGASPHDVVFRMGTLSLLRYRRQTPAVHAEPVLFCYALVNRPYILDLQPDKSVVQRYLDRGFEVYLIDWGVPSIEDRGRTLEDYVCKTLARVVEAVLFEQGQERLHLLGYCMGGTLSALYAALYPEQLQTLTLLAAPIDFSGRDGLLHVWTDRRYFDVDAFIDAFGNCPATFLQTCFLSMKPVQNLLEKNLTFWEKLDDPGFLTSHFAMEYWVNDNIPVAGETFREFVKKLYQGNQLVRGELHLGEQRVDLRRVSCPLLLLTASNDHLVRPASTHGIRAHVGSNDVAISNIDAGHVGLVVSGRAHRALWPQATSWLAQRSSARLEGAAAAAREVAREPS
jgi:polyhydroxyalkanoate synthase subunit PhaC